MTKGGFTSAATAATVLAADNARSEVTIQNQGADKIWLGFGVTAVKETGICLIPDDYPTHTVTGHLAQQSISVVCDTAEESAGGYQTA